jgi:hypothetical protein
MSFIHGFHYDPRGSLGELTPLSSNDIQPLNFTPTFREVQPVPTPTTPTPKTNGWDVLTNLVTFAGSIWGGQQQPPKEQQQEEKTPDDNRIALNTGAKQETTQQRTAGITWEAFQQLSKEQKEQFVKAFPDSDIAKRYQRNKMLKWAAIIGGGAVVLTVGGIAIHKSMRKKEDDE